MRVKITASWLRSNDAKPKEKPFEALDTETKGFLVRVQPSGVRTYYVQWARGRRKDLGRVDRLSPEQARERAGRVLSNVTLGNPPLQGIGGAEKLTLRQFIEDTYAPWLTVHKPSGATQTLGRLETCFGSWFADPLTDITTERIQAWTDARARAKRAPTTILRDVMTLSGVLTRAVKLKKIPSNPVAGIDKPRLDRNPKVRFLSPDEEKRLRTALAERDSELRTARDSANEWRRDRAREEMPRLIHFGDHLTPIVLLALNTGMRKSEILKLTWAAVDLKGAQLMVEGSTAKSRQTRYVPLNAEALAVLTSWRAQYKGKERVFPVIDNFKTSWTALLVRAAIKKFRFHDCRHHFASRLVQLGVPLNTVRELLGHADLKMTLRYAHLSPDVKTDAVARLSDARP